MGRAPCCDKNKVKRGPWSLEEDTLLKSFIHAHGTGGNWISLPHKAGLNRCGKSCRLRWLNYLRPNIKHGGFTEEEDYIICKLYSSIGSRWSVIASKLSGRTDNDVKNYWNTKLKKKIMAGKVSGFDDNLFHKTGCNTSPNGLARLGWTGFGEMVPKPEITAFDYGASFVPYTQAVEGQQSWGPYIYGGVHDIEEKKSSVCDSQSVSCGSSSIQKVGEEFAENDTEDFWLKLLVDQSTFMGGGCGPCGSSSSEIGLHDKINELASVVRGASFSFPGYY